MAGTMLGGKGGADGTPAPVTLESVMVEVNKSIDAKLGARFDDFKKTGLGDAIKAQVEPITSQLSTINDALGKLVVQPPVTDSASGGGGGGGGKGQLPPEWNAKFKSMEDAMKSQGSEIVALKTAKESAEKRAEETDRHSTIRTALNGMPFVNEKAAETAFSIVSPHVRRLDDGSLVAGIAGDNFPVDAFSKDYLQKEHAYLFKASGSSGSGAQPGSNLRLSSKADMNDIKPNMKPETREAVAASIAAALQPQA